MNDEGDEQRPFVAVVGGGPGGLMAAEVLARGGARVTVFDQMPSMGRKLLLAGRGGLNLTHSEPFEELLARYGTARSFLEPALRRFPPAALREWCESLGQPTFVGSSGRVFPDAFRATPLLRAWLGSLTELGVEFRPRHRFVGWADDGALRFEAPDIVEVRPDATVLALGGASWPRTGSDGAWVETFRSAGTTVVPLRPANCGFEIAWSTGFVHRFGGAPLKNIAVRRAGSTSEPVRGEAVITSYGIEGGAVYAIGAELRDEIGRSGFAELLVDLHPDLSVSALATRLSRHRAGDSFASHLRRAAGLTALEIAVISERADARRLEIDDADAIACVVKQLPLRLVAARPIERAISTAGGIALDEVDDRYMLRRRPCTFVLGEMLDWEAPTGGYLLQATFSTAVMAAEGVLDWCQPA